MIKRRRTPQEKKRASLTKDRRNVYGESPHAARKNIPRRKAAKRRAARRAANQALTSVHGQVDATTADVAGVTATRRPTGKAQRFRKTPDAPLGRVLAGKRARRARMAARRR